MSTMLQPSDEQEEKTIAGLISMLKMEHSSTRGEKLRLHDLLGEKMNGGHKSPPQKKLSVLQRFRYELNILMMGKEEFIRKQRHSSLVIDPRRIDDDGIMSRFAPLYQQVSQLHTDPEEHEEHLKLIKDIVKGSIVHEWPRSVYGVHKSGHDEPTEVDQAPLIHRARNVVKCRTSHPTMRIKVYALTEAQQRDSGGPPLLEAFFRCSLTKAQAGVIGEQCDTSNATIAGRMILSQREDTEAPASFTGVMVNNDGKLVASQAAPDYQSFDILNSLNEGMQSTSFKYENGVLCATFPEIGVTLNSMFDRRQLANRYTILNEVFIKIDNLLIEHAFQSLPFLIAITNAQTEPLLNSIIWSRMLDKEHYDGSEPQSPITYGVLREAARQFVKSQISQARSLTDRELLHFQAMQFLPKVNKCRSELEVEDLDNSLYLDTEEIPEMKFADTVAGIDNMIEAKRKLKDKLLSKFVKDHVIIEKQDLMGETCVSILDGRSELRHTPWQWLFKATELILDVDKKLYPSSADDNHTMMSLFNKGIVSFFSVYDTRSAFKQLKEDGKDVQDGGSVILRFCDENAGHISFVFGLDGNDRLIMGPISGEMIKDFKQGLAEALMDDENISKHGRLVRMNVHPDRHSGKYCTTIRKRSLFRTYQSPRQQNEANKTPFPEEEITKRIYPFSGTEVNLNKFNLSNTTLDSLASSLASISLSSSQLTNQSTCTSDSSTRIDNKPNFNTPLDSLVSSLTSNTVSSIPFTNDSTCTSDSSIRKIKKARRILLESKNILHRESTVCGICNQDLSRKATVSLDSCRHEFHRSCLHDWCELGTHQPEAVEGGPALPAPCPQCDSSFTKVNDERGGALPMIIHHGPTGELSTKFVATLLERNNVRETIDAMHVLTSTRLQWASEQLVKARILRKSPEYINDLAAEKEKMRKRINRLFEIKRKCSAPQRQTQDAAKEDPPRRPPPDNMCVICQDDLSAKRTAKLATCGHEYHRTCIIASAEFQQNMKWGRQIESTGLQCGLCRAKNCKILDEGGLEIPPMLAFEKCDAFLHDPGSDTTEARVDRMNRERRNIVHFFGKLVEVKKCALRDGKDEGYVGDIVNEMEKLRNRLITVDRFLLFVAVKALMRRREREGVGVGDAEGNQLHNWPLVRWITQAQADPEDEQQPPMA